ncbi:hypothetical protein [Actinokineospora bangkokensis]|uniref:hypothetical protein n=1 Tax=Actinokineospora bangkokensis TaxID=1193682 RepID=UPI001177A619|nr:hypothetical protein [Actinokineospora bangkokensis]
MRGQLERKGRDVVDARLRGVRPHLAAIVLVGPALAAAATALSGRLALLAVPALLVAASAWYFRTSALRPRRWPAAAAAFGALAGAHAGAGAVLFWPAFPVAAAAFAVAAHRLAAGARRRVLEPYTPELADSRVEVPWQARGDRGLQLLVGHDRITLAGSRGPFRLVRPMVALSGVGAVEQILVARRATLEVPGVGELRVTVTPGPAVRITVPPGQWIVPTDHGREIARLVARRKELAGVD